MVVGIGGAVVEVGAVEAGATDAEVLGFDDDSFDSASGVANGDSKGSCAELLAAGTVSGDAELDEPALANPVDRVCGMAGAGGWLLVTGMTALGGGSIESIGRAASAENEIVSGMVNNGRSCAVCVTCRVWDGICSSLPRLMNAATVRIAATSKVAAVSMRPRHRCTGKTKSSSALAVD